MEFTTQYLQQPAEAVSMYQETGEVIGPYEAVIKGKNTGFSGCDNIDCGLRDSCLRADSQLKVRRHYRCSNA